MLFHKVLISFLTATLVTQNLNNAKKHSWIIAL